MPRDLFPERHAEQAPFSNSSEPDTLEKLTESGESEDDDESTLYPNSYNRPRMTEAMKKTERREELHPYVSTLSLADVESCVRLEEASFPEHERCSREKFIYRLTKCGEMASGLFATAKPDSPLSSASTAASAHPPDSTNPDHKGILLAHVVSTKCDSEVVTDESMDFPPEWRQGVSEHDRRGHQEKGRTIALHSLGVLPAYQRIGLGRTVLKSYIQRMETAGVADRIALIAHGHLVKYYETFGFVNKGESAAQFGGGGWNDLVYEFTNTGPGG